MSTSRPLVIVVTDFEVDVIASSSEIPVLVDFWGEWCHPCVALGRTLEDLAEEFGGAFILAKFDVGADRELAARLGVRGLPTVKLFRDGEAVDGFSGALPKMQVRKFLQEKLPG